MTAQLLGISYGTVIGSTYAALGGSRSGSRWKCRPWIDLGGLRRSATVPDDAIRFFRSVSGFQRPPRRSLDRLAKNPSPCPTAASTPAGISGMP